MNAIASQTTQPSNSMPSPSIQPIPGRSPIQGFKNLLQGPAGTGKTTALQTLLGQGLEICPLFLDPGYEVLGADILNQMSWQYIRPAAPNWKAMADNSNQLNKINNKTLQELASINPENYRQFIDVLNQCANFKTHDGRTLGAIDSWGTDKVFVLDNLSILSAMVRRLGVGSKPIMSQPDWGKCMQHIEDFFDVICFGLRCHVVVIAHVEPEKDEVSGQVMNMTSTLGKKLAPKLSPKFSDVVLARLSGTKFSWRTTDSNTDLKTRYLPIHQELEPSFKHLVNAWKAKGGIIERS